jgi:hypothetical protein
MCYVEFWHSNMSYATVFVRYIRGTWRNLSFPLILVVIFYYVINKLIILISDTY